MRDGIWPIGSRQTRADSLSSSNLERASQQIQESTQSGLRRTAAPSYCTACYRMTQLVPIQALTDDAVAVGSIGGRGGAECGGFSFRQACWSWGLCWRVALRRQGRGRPSVRQAAQPRSFLPSQGLHLGSAADRVEASGSVFRQAEARPRSAESINEERSQHIRLRRRMPVWAGSRSIRQARSGLPSDPRARSAGLCRTARSPSFRFRL